MLTLHSGKQPWESTKRIARQAVHPHRIRVSMTRRTTPGALPSPARMQFLRVSRIPNSFAGATARGTSQASTAYLDPRMCDYLTIEHETEQRVVPFSETWKFNPSYGCKAMLGSGDLPCSVFQMKPACGEITLPLEKTMPQPLRLRMSILTFAIICC